MRSDKYRRMLKTAAVKTETHAAVAVDCLTVRDAIADAIPEELYEQLTGYQLGLAMQAVNQSYHRGRAALNRDVKDGTYIIY